MSLYLTGRTRVITPFDPWRGRLCTCPPKLSLDPYTGCQHGCLYCYASSYIRDFFRCRPKRRLLENVRRDLEKVKAGALISMSNSSDPYPPMEADLRLTRRCLEAFRGRGLRVLVVTKGTTVLRDLELLKELGAAVTVSLITLDAGLCRRLEPGAPSPSERLEVLSRLSEEGVPTGLRLDPIIPFLTDDQIEAVVREAVSAGVRHVVASTLKPRPDGWARLRKAFPEECERLDGLYRNGMRVGGAMYLPSDLRRSLLERALKECIRAGITFSTCREGFPDLNRAPTCDGSHLIRGAST